MLERISEIDERTWECEGSEEDVNAYLASKDATYLRRSTVEIRRDEAKGTVIARVTSDQPPEEYYGFTWDRGPKGRLQMRWLTSG